MAGISCDQHGGFNKKCRGQCNDGTAAVLVLNDMSQAAEAVLADPGKTVKIANAGTVATVQAEWKIKASSCLPDSVLESVVGIEIVPQKKLFDCIEGAATFSRCQAAELNQEFFKPLKIMVVNSNSFMDRSGVKKLTLMDNMRGLIEITQESAVLDAAYDYELETAGISKADGTRDQNAKTGKSIIGEENGKGKPVDILLVLNKMPARMGFNQATENCRKAKSSRSVALTSRDEYKSTVRVLTRCDDRNPARGCKKVPGIRGQTFESRTETTVQVRDKRGHMQTVVTSVRDVVIDERNKNSRDATATISRYDIAKGTMTRVDYTRELTARDTTGTARRQDRSSGQNSKTRNRRVETDRTAGSGQPNRFPQRTLNALDSNDAQASTTRRLSHSVAHPEKRRQLDAMDKGTMKRRLGRHAISSFDAELFSLHAVVEKEKHQQERRRLHKLRRQLKEEEEAEAATSTAAAAGSEGQMPTLLAGVNTAANSMAESTAVVPATTAATNEPAEYTREAVSDLTIFTATTQGPPTAANGGLPVPGATATATPTVLPGFGTVTPPQTTGVTTVFVVGATGEPAWSGMIPVNKDGHQTGAPQELIVHLHTERLTEETDEDDDTAAYTDPAAGTEPPAATMDANGNPKLTVEDIVDDDWMTMMDDATMGGDIEQWVYPEETFDFETCAACATVAQGAAVEPCTSSHHDHVAEYEVHKKLDEEDRRKEETAALATKTIELEKEATAKMAILDKNKVLKTFEDALQLEDKVETRQKILDTKTEIAAETVKAETAATVIKAKDAEVANIKQEDIHAANNVDRPATGMAFKTAGSFGVIVESGVWKKTDVAAPDHQIIVPASTMIDETLIPGFQLSCVSKNDGVLKINKKHVPTPPSCVVDDKGMQKCRRVRRLSNAHRGRTLNKIDAPIVSQSKAKEWHANGAL